MKWNPTDEDISYYKKINQDEEDNVEYYRIMLPLLLGKINEDYEQTFEPTSLPSNVKLFLALAINFYGSDIGVTSERMGSVSYSYDFSALPSTITDLLISYEKRSKKVRFYASW